VDNNKTSSWKRDLHFNNEDIKNDRIIDATINIIKEHIESHNLTRDNNILTIISELLNNEIDHSILAINSNLKEKANGFSLYKEERSKRLAEITAQYIDISTSIRNTGDDTTLTIFLKSSGTTSYPNIEDIAIKPHKPYGRGLFLIKELCETFSIDKDNRIISLVYKW